MIPRGAFLPARLARIYRDGAQSRADPARRQASVSRHLECRVSGPLQRFRIAFLAQPQIPPRNVNWSSSGKWAHAAKIGFEKYFIHKMRKGESEPFYETLAPNARSIDKLKSVKADA